jgi:tetratricopeptide (TPR) repeat protein
VLADRAAALCEVALGEPRAAYARLRRAEAVAVEAGLTLRATEVRTGLAFLLLQLEDPDGAVREVRQAMAVAPDPASLGAAQSQYAVILMRLGRYSEAIQETDRALANLRTAASATQIARLRSNRGIVWTYLGDFDRAETELHLALELHRRQGSELSAAQVVHNLGFVAARRGDVPAALRFYDEALAAYERLELPKHLPDIDRCEVLMSAHLLPEAREAAEAAVEGLASSGLGADLAEARLMLAEVALAGRDDRTALEQAALAGEAFERQQRRNWAALAGYVAARARWATADAGADAGAGADARPDTGAAAADAAARPEADTGAGAATAAAAPREPLTAHPAVKPVPALALEEGPSLAESLEAAGWRLQALETRIATARAALDSGDAGAALEVLSNRRPPSRRSSADERVRAWYAEALWRLASGNRPGALRALRAGLRVAEEHRVAFGATELRARAATDSSELAELGLDLALERGQASSVLVWAERWRARSLWRPAVVPPANPDLAKRLSDLRHVVAGLERAALAGEATDGLEHERARIEAQIRHLSLRDSPGSPGAGLPPPPSVGALREKLAQQGSALVEFISRNGTLYAVTCDASGCRLHELASAAEVEHQQAALRFAFGRLVYRRSAPASLEVAAHLLRRTSAALDDLLVRKLRPLLGDVDEETQTAAGNRQPNTRRRPLVLVPTGELHTIPWALLPSFAGRPISVVPSVGLWLARQRTTSVALKGQDPTDPAKPRLASRSGVVVVAGPGVRTGAQEARSLRRLYPDARVLEGSQATVRNAAMALEGAALAHVAAHGRFRSDNALFSALDLCDGPLTVYDLEAISRPPALMVLSACDAGRSQVHPGDELMGTTAALLGLGTDVIVASVAPVPDPGAPSVMIRFHTHLRRGEAPAVALARSQQELCVASLSEKELASGSGRALEALAAAAFVCFGAGEGGARP